jgi:hypothetical protein
MSSERWIRVLAGSLVLAGLALAHWHCEWWLLLPAFVGANLLQSSFTNWCPMMAVLKVCGVKREWEKHLMAELP